MRTMNLSPKVIMITGAAGYVGAMLCDQLSRCPELEKIVAIDILPMPVLLKDNKKVIWITASLYQNVWKIPALINKPEIIIHAAWQGRELDGKEELQKKLNVDSSQAVFDFAFKNKFVRKIVYFSSVFAYGAFPQNSVETLFNEDDELREVESLGCFQKRQTEEFLSDMYKNSDKSKQVFVLRLPSITGPRGRSMRASPFMPIAFDGWRGQYVHEDDVVDAVAMFTFAGDPKKDGTYEVFVLSPNDLVTIHDIAKIFNKNIIKAPPFFIRLAFYLARNLFGDKTPTGRGEWRFFCYPICVDGSRITKEYNFDYTYTSCGALSRADGRYGPVADG